MAKRIRMFAGPNGSGKSTIFTNVRRQFYSGVFVNADQIERTLRLQGFVNLHNYNIIASTRSLDDFITSFGLAERLSAQNKQISLSLVDNVVTVKDADIHSYTASILAAFIRMNLLATSQTFSFETVMSHASKVDFLQRAKAQQFKTYLYYVCTDSPDSNVARVNQRVAKGGHPVPEDKIVSRYYRSLELLKSAVNATNRSYIFDNSGSDYRLVLEVANGNDITIHDPNIPSWITRHFLNK